MSLKCLSTVLGLRCLLNIPHESGGGGVGGGGGGERERDRIKMLAQTFDSYIIV
jgi:hypothetical protein